ncbi:GNAT family N-acetyltransferase [Herbidospora mongoliensis]|uniref:GNAT family N-acetyltransferase n=1 Tax=Herbidospora mongoliensis TaxID=688067 RepID=UPI00082F0BEA|nr:GNAT family N-acetyltransferase [Herbidospora mongoliensis]
MNVTFTHLTGPDAAVVVNDAYTAVYTLIRAEPPYSSGPLYHPDRYRDRTGSQLDRPGFTLVAVEDGETLAGFAFGFSIPAGGWWGGETTPGRPEIVEAPKFAVIELNLRVEYRGRGIGKRLLTELLNGRDEPYATLLSLPEAAAHDIYEHWGWNVTGTCRPAPDTMVADVMVLEL